MSSKTDGRVYSGAAYNAMMEEETKESLVRMVLDGFEERDRLTQQRDQFLEERKAATQDYTAERATNAELLRLLERHHAASVAGDNICQVHYVGSELCLKTEAAIERAKEKV